MKTVFEGVVNGQRFNNVNDYNKAITAAINNGEEINASSSTKTVSTPPASHQGILTLNNINENLLIGMDPEEYYANGSIDLDEWEKALADNYDTLKDIIPHLSFKDLEDYRTQIDWVFERLSSDENEMYSFALQCEKEEESLLKRLEELKQNYEKNQLMLKLNASLQAHFHDLHTYVSDELEVIYGRAAKMCEEKCNHDGDCKCNCDGKCQCGGNCKCKSEKIKKASEGIYALLHEIFK
ncbi:MAG: hypothetical protein IKU29_04445 [Parabacteroides sp.]|nr:hypothetical protein [Parabacteroides sp.]